MRPDARGGRLVPFSERNGGKRRALLRSSLAPTAIRKRDIPWHHVGRLATRATGFNANATRSDDRHVPLTGRRRVQNCRRVPRGFSGRSGPETSRRFGRSRTRICIVIAPQQWCAPALKSLINATGTGATVAGKGSFSRCEIHGNVDPERGSVRRCVRALRLPSYFVNQATTDKPTDSPPIRCTTTTVDASGTGAQHQMAREIFPECGISSASLVFFRRAETRAPGEIENESLARRVTPSKLDLPS